MNNAFIKVHCPATVANMVCGFDILGFALEEPNDIMHVRLIEEPKIIIQNLDDYGLPNDPEKNVAGVVFKEIMQHEGNTFGFEVTIQKSIKPGSGLGSSAASAAGAAVAANHLLNHKFTNDELIQFAMFGEKLACGVKHADNITPCIMGGVTLVRSIHPLDIVRLNAPELYAAVVHPQIEVKTSDARQILRKEVPLKDAIRQWGNIAGLVAGLEQGNYELISRSLEDVIVEPVRSMLIPGFDEVKQKSKEAGALGGGISGSGPSLFMLCRERDTALSVQRAMQQVFAGMGIEYKSYVSKLSQQGVICTES